MTGACVHIRECKVNEQVSTLYKEELKRTASHEAGHAVIFVHLGLRFHPVNIYSEQPEVKPDLSGEDESKAAEIARKEIVIAYAGAAAQRMLHPDQPEVEITYESDDDRKNIEDILRDFPSLRAELDQCRKEAASLVQQFRVVIKEVAGVLLKRTLTFGDVEEIYRKWR
jgi:hypothetical protein